MSYTRCQYQKQIQFRPAPRLILHIIDEACVRLDTYAPFPGKAKLEKCTLYCLSIIEKALATQALFFDAHFAANCSILMSGTNKLLLGVNPRSGKPDNMLNITKFVTYNTWLPHQALLAVKILTFIARQPNVSSLLIGEFTRTAKLANEIRHGFVECLESDVNVVDNSENSDPEFRDSVQLTLKDAIINLLEECLPQSAPNLSHYLFGFDISKDIRATRLQQPGVLDFPSNCIKSLVTILDEALEVCFSTIFFFTLSLQLTISLSLFLSHSFRIESPASKCHQRIHGSFRTPTNYCIRCASIRKRPTLCYVSFDRVTISSVVTLPPCHFVILEMVTH